MSKVDGKEIGVSPAELETGDVRLLIDDNQPPHEIVMS